MDSFTFRHETRSPLGGSRGEAIVGVVASGNLEVLLERVLPPNACEVVVETQIRGYEAVWAAVVADFVERAQPGGIRLSINDGGARPDTVSLRLLQGARLMSA